MTIIERDLQRIEQLTRFDTISIIHLQENFRDHKIDRFAAACNLELSDDEKRMSIADYLPGEFYEIFIAPHENKQIISVHRWCGNPNKSWDYAEYKALVQTFAADEQNHIILWDMGDPEPAIRGENITNMQDYTEVLKVGISAGIMKHCAVHIGADSLPMHIASAMDIPTLAIFERTIASVAAPLNKNAVIALTTTAVHNGDLEFFEREQNRLALCGLDAVTAEHLYPILAKMGFLDSTAYPVYPKEYFDYKGFKLVAPKSDHFAFGAAEDWKELKLVDALNAYIRPGKSVFMDIGANVGRNTFLMDTDKLASGIAIEPQPEIYDMLVENLQNLGDNFTAHHFALMETECTLTLNLVRRQSGSVLPSTEHKGYLCVDVDAKPLDALGYAPDIIKIDVEGMELDVLCGGMETLKTARAVAIEVHHNDESELICDFLLDLGFNIRYLTVPAPHAPHHILATAKDEPIYPFPTNCFYDPAELRTLAYNSDDTVERMRDIYGEKTEFKEDRTDTYWFELLGLARINPLGSLDVLDRIGFEKNGASKYLDFMSTGSITPQRIILNFLYSETGDPIRYKGELVYPLNEETLAELMAECREQGYVWDADDTDFLNVDTTDPRNLPDPNIPLTRGRLVLKRTG